MKEPSKEFLLAHDEDLGGGVGDPAGRDRDGDVCAKPHGGQCRQNHLARNGQHGHEEADAEARGDRFTTWMPQLTIEDGGENFDEPGMALQAGAAQQTVSPANKSEVTSFEFGCHGESGGIGRYLS